MDQKTEIMTEQTQEPFVGLFKVLLLAVAVALSMVVITTVIFLRSGAYTTVKQIQIGSSLIDSKEFSDVKDTSPIKADDIDFYSKNINTKIDTIDDNADFGPENVSDKYLGL